MKMETVTLTRAQWNAIWDHVKQIRNAAGDIDMVHHTLRDVGLDKPADRLIREVGTICDSAHVILAVIIAAEDAMSPELNATMGEGV